VFISARQQDQGHIQNYVRAKGAQLHSRKSKPIRGMGVGRDKSTLYKGLVRSIAP